MRYKKPVENEKSDFKLDSSRRNNNHKLIIRATAARWLNVRP